MGKAVQIAIVPGVTMKSTFRSSALTASINRWRQLFIVGDLHRPALLMQGGLALRDRASVGCRRRRFLCDA
jgi:hypothetical protein